jgi:hypothetical protein
MSDGREQREERENAVSWKRKKIAKTGSTASPLINGSRSGRTPDREVANLFRSFSQKITLGRRRMGDELESQWRPMADCRQFTQVLEML